MSRLKNKVAIITGAGRGIGFAAAQAFVREGAKVVIAEINEELGRSAETQLRAAGGEATFVRADCACSEDVQALIARTETLYGGLQVLYNNASVYLDRIDGPVTELAEETWTKILAINLNSVFLCCKYALPLMIRNGGGSIINTGSSASQIGIPNCDAYTASKGRNDRPHPFDGCGVRTARRARKLHRAGGHHDADAAREQSRAVVCV